MSLKNLKQKSNELTTTNANRVVGRTRRAATISEFHNLKFKFKFDPKALNFVGPFGVLRNRF